MSGRKRAYPLHYFGMKEQQRKSEFLIWREISRDVLLEGPIFTINQVRRRSTGGAEGDFILLDAPDWVAVVPLLDGEEGEEHFLMVEQFRHGSGKVTIEFPAGTIDRGEDPAEAGARELFEETGYQAEKLHPIGEISPNPAFMNNRVFFFAATGLRKKGEQQLDEYEQIRFHIQPVGMVEELMGTGQYDNSVMMNALWYYHMWKRER